MKTLINKKQYFMLRIGLPMTCHCIMYVYVQYNITIIVILIQAYTGYIMKTNRTTNSNFNIKYLCTTIACL